MTYDDLEIIPVKGLNLVLGLNGSGKSSIMCAICLGLGGKPQYTGRAGQISDFIKYNHTEAIIEIELESHCDKNDVIKLVIRRDKQSWYLNNKLVNQSKITSVVKKYNIDMSNLFQFLPQEKVAEFSKMDKRQRLVNMIQAIGDPNLITLFDELKTLRKNFVRLEKDLEELENNKASEEKIYEKLKPEIENQEDRKTLEQDLKLYRLQKIGFEYNNINNEVLKKKAKCKELQKEILQIERHCNELETEKLRVENASDVHVHQTKIEELKGIIYKFMQNLAACDENLRTFHEQVDYAKICFENRMKVKKEQTEKLAYLSNQIKETKDTRIQEKDHMADLEDKLRKITSLYVNVEQQLFSWESEIGNLNIKKKALESQKMFKEREIKSHEDKKYEVLRHNYPDTYKALQWLKTNKSSFKSSISYPPLVSIEVQSDEQHKFIENTVGVCDLLAFIFEDEEDLERFLIVMKHQQLSVNVSMVPDESLADLQSQPITEQMRNLGIHCYLKDLFTAPDPVVRYLCQINRVHQVPVCNEKAEENINSILKYSSLFLTASKKISGRKSYYGQQSISVKIEDLVGQNLLPSMENNSAKKELQEIEKSLEVLRPQFETLERQRSQLEHQQEQLRNEKNNINMEIRKLNELNTKLKQFSDNYERSIQDIVNEEIEKKKVTDEISNLNSKKLDVLTEMKKITKEIIKSKEEKAVSIIYVKRFNEKITSLKEKISAVGLKLNNKQSKVSKLEQERDQLKTEAKKLYQVLQETAEKDQQNLKVLFASPIDLQEIEQQICCIEAKLELANEDIDTIMAEYQRSESALLRMEEQINKITAEMKDLKIKIQEKKKIWLAPLESHIETVNKKFSDYYKILKCAGEISLDETDDTDDFLNYGLQIKLKYKADDEFMELSPTYYSGGECSVATIIFILSLQEFTDVPFRCIDEINQGMDAINERKIYKLIAEAAENESCCQYFLLSPKLLMDLEYHKDVAVHIIFNSHFLRGSLNAREHVKIKKSIRR